MPPPSRKFTAPGWWRRARADLPYIKEYLLYVLERADEDRIFQVAGSLTYTTLLSLVPLITVGLVMFAAFPLFGELRDDLEYFAAGMLPEETARAIQKYLSLFAEQAANLTAVGIVFLMVTAVMLLLTIENAFNQIWRVTKPRPLAQRVMVYWTGITLGPVLIGASLAVTSYLVSTSVGWVSQVPGVGRVGLGLMPILLHTVAFSLLYGMMPHREIELKHALIGGFVTALIFEATKRIFGLYIAFFPTYSMVYGAFAAIPIFLLWIYLSWFVALFGAVLTATLPLYRFERAALRHSPGVAFYEALAILKHLYAARAQRGPGAGATMRQIRAALKIGFENTESRLDALQAAGWATRTEAKRWVLTCDPAQVRASDVFQRFVFNASQALMRVPEEEPAVKKLIAQVGDWRSSFSDPQLDSTLDQLFARGSNEANWQPAASAIAEPVAETVAMASVSGPASDPARAS